MKKNSGAGHENRPLASLSIDLDNEWAYLKTHGDAAWENYPSYLDLAVPRILETLERYNLRATVFIVGQDAAQPRNRAALAPIAAAGHEIGCHSLRHEPWLHLYTEQELERELEEAERHIAEATGTRPVGFRGPGFSLSDATLRVLARRGYEYDASTLPSFLGPLARAYYLATGRFSREERQRLGQLFGGFREGMRPLKPYRWQVGDASIIEMPVTTFPVVRAPVHLTYVMFLAGFAPALARGYFSAALAACRVTGVEPSILLHPLDFLGAEDVPSLHFFPSMRMPRERKLMVLDACVSALGRRFRVMPMREHARCVAERGELRTMNFA